MNKKDYKYIENRLNELCKHHVKIVYDKNNSSLYYNGDEIAFDNIIVKIYGFKSFRLSISKKYISYNFIINLIYNRYLEVTNK